MQQTKRKIKFEMSHISRFEADQRRLEAILETPINKRRSVKAFYRAGEATPAAFIPTTTPGRRRIDAGTDLIAEIEEEANTESLKGTVDCFATLLRITLQNARRMSKAVNFLVKTVNFIVETARYSS